MQLERNGEPTFSWNLSFTWRKWNCLVVLALKPVTEEFARAFRLARKERNGSLVAATLTLSGALIWCSGEMQVSMQSHQAGLNQSCAGGGRANSTIPQSGVGNLESLLYSDSTVAHSHPQLRPVAPLPR